MGRVYDPVPNATDQALGAVESVFQTVESVRLESARVGIKTKIDRVRAKFGSLLGAQISDNALRVLLTIEPGKLRDAQSCARRIVQAAMAHEIREDPAELQAAKTAIEAQARDAFTESQSLGAAVAEVAKDSVRPNSVFNEDRTAALQRKAQEQVQPVYRLIMRRELVIAKGETVQQEHIERFEALGLRNPKIDFGSVASLTLLVCVVVVLMLAYLARYYPGVYANTRILLLLALIVIGSTFALRVGGSMLGIKLSPDQVGYLGVLWVVTAGMLLAVLLNPQIAVVVTALLAIVLSLLVNAEMRYAASALITSLMGIYSVANLRDRAGIMRATGILAVTGILMVWAMGGINSDSLADMLTGSVWAVVIAVGATWLFWSGTYLLERPFETTTHLSLLELADTNKPLLRRLVMEAPGTYTHCMAVGYLAESAAEAIGADSLLSRVASYYHDIGKLRRPHFFIENQPMENVHDRMNPTLSALVITSHIKDGIEIANQSRMPKVVLDIIEQHHGTSLAQYFYDQFTVEQDPSTALEQQFRYSGPKPQTREAGIVMLADAIEAASRTLTKPTLAKIELLVNRIVADRLGDGQLDESDLTFKEISKITESFIRAKISTMHARIEYPDALSSRREEGRGQWKY